jgi:hypothetical protein
MSLVENYAKFYKEENYLSIKKQLAEAESKIKRAIELGRHLTSHLDERKINSEEFYTCIIESLNQFNSLAEQLDQLLESKTLTKRILDSGSSELGDPKFRETVAELYTPIGWRIEAGRDESLSILTFVLLFELDFIKTELTLHKSKELEQKLEFLQNVQKELESSPNWSENAEVYSLSLQKVKTLKSLNEKIQPLITELEKSKSRYMLALISNWAIGITLTLLVFAVPFIFIALIPDIFLILFIGFTVLMVEIILLVLPIVLMLNIHNIVEEKFLKSKAELNPLMEFKTNILQDLMLAENEAELSQKTEKLELKLESFILAKEDFGITKVELITKKITELLKVPKIPVLWSDRYPIERPVSNTKTNAVSQKPAAPTGLVG